MRIIDEIGMPAYLEQLAEESAELAQAALKYARLLREENPTTKTEDGCIENLAEELADVSVCSREILENDWFASRFFKYEKFKRERWERHLKEREHEP